MKKNILLALLLLAFSQSNAQTNDQEDVVVLKTGKEYTGQIIEQIPGNCIKLLRFPESDTVIFYMTQIEKLKKQNKQATLQNKVATTEMPPAAASKSNNYHENSTQQIGNDLTIFTELGYRFALYINGKRCNEEFATRVTVENINHDWVTIGVLFEDPERGLIEKNIGLSGKDDVLPYTNTYRIIAKNNRLVLRLHDYSVKKIAQGSTNILIQRDPAPAGTNLNIHHSTRIRK